MNIVTVLPHQKQLGKGHSKRLSRKARHRLEIIDWYNQVSERKSQSGLKDASLTCRHFGIERSYFYRWYGRFKKHGIAGLENRTSRPKRVRREAVGAEIVEEIRRIKGEVPTSSNEGWNAIICDFTKSGYRLPTEAEWELAARGGNAGAEAWKNTYAGSSSIDGVAWYNKNSTSKTHQVGTKAANSLGLYDMSGNVWEWCWDWYDSIDADTPSGGAASGSAVFFAGAGSSELLSPHPRILPLPLSPPWAILISGGLRLLEQSMVRRSIVCPDCGAASKEHSMKVLVVGGAGYIGSHVVKELMGAGHSVTVFDNLSSGLLQNLFPENDFIAGDILHPETLDSAFGRGFDAFIHLAAFKAAGESMTAPEKYSVNNITGTLNLMNAAVKHGCLNMVFSSSAAVFGEPQYLPINEDHPKNPENYYGFTKLEIERFMDWYDRLKGLKFAALRYFNAAGYDPSGFPCGLEQNPANLLPVIMEVASGMRQKLQVFGTDYDTRDGTCIRDYVHVTDLAIAHVKALDYICKNKTSLKVNLGSETGVTVKEMLEAARRITGKEIPADFVGRRAGDPACLYATSAYARETLGWQANHSDVDTLVSSTWGAYCKHQEKK